MAIKQSQGSQNSLPSDARSTAPAPAAIRARALIIGCLAVVLTALLVTQAEMVLSNVLIGYLQFPPVSLGLLLVAVAISRGTQRLAKRWDLTPSDLIVIYCMVLIAAMVSSHGVVQKWVPLLVAPKYFANASNDWFNLFIRHIPQPLVPWIVQDSGKSALVQDYYNKAPRGSAIPWQPWIVPLLNWSILIGLVLFAFVCLTAILRRQWVDNEKLGFPLTQLPLEIAGDQERRSFFSNPLMWFGVALPVAVYVTKGLHLLQPSVPDVPLNFSINDYLTLPPWNQLAPIPIILSFSALGFFFLLPTDILLSIWFFFLLTRVQQIIAIASNFDSPIMPLYHDPIFIGYQTVGAYVVISAYFFWLARPHLSKVWAAAIGREKGDDSQELLPYRVAVWGLFGSIIASSLWLWAAGMSPWLALFELVVFIFVIALVMSRTTAEAGMLMTETTFRPIDIYRMFGSVHALGPSNLTMLAFFDNLFLRDQRGLLLCGFLDGSRLADGAQVSRRSFVGVFALGVVLATVIAVGLNLYFPYHLGAGTMGWWMEQGSPQTTFQGYAPYFRPETSGTGSAWQMPVFFLVGAGVTVFLTVMRASFFWWPLHPLGYALSGSWSTIEFWFPCFMAWVFKSLSVRYGGIRFYQKARPFFLGLVIGEFGMQVWFALMNLLFKLPAPTFPWG